MSEDDPKAPPGTITDAQLQKLQSHLEEKQGAAPKCSECGTNSWMVAGPYKMPFTRGPDYSSLSTAGMPVVVLICRNCYFVKQFAWKPIMEGR